MLKRRRDCGAVVSAALWSLLGLNSIATAQSAFLPACESQTVMGSTTSGGDSFGGWTALEGDWAAVGAVANDNENGVDAGAVYMFHREGAAWSETQRLIAWDGGPADTFGQSLAISGSWLAVGTPQHYWGGNGAVYMFHFDGAAWQPFAKLTASDGQPSSLFGMYLALRGSRMVSGAGHQQVGSMPYAGKVYVFDFNGSAWIESAQIVASDAETGAVFGQDVALGDDRIVTSRLDEWLGFTGSAYVFRLEGGTWIEEARLSAESPQSYDYFYHLAMEGDLISVGADQRWGPGPGFVEVFRRTGTTWTREAHLTPSDGGFGDGFGMSTSIDGETMAIASVPPAGIGSTGVYLFEHDASGWHESQKAVPSSYQTVANHVGFDGSDLLAGSIPSDRVYVFSLGPDCNDNGVGDACDIMGGSSADMNGNGVPDECNDAMFLPACESQVLVGSTGAVGDSQGVFLALDGDWAAWSAILNDNENGVDAGVVFVAHRTGAAWSETQRLLAWDGRPGDYFGYQVALSGEWLAVGAPQNSWGGNGAVYMFRFDGAAWQPFSKLTASDPQPSSVFGGAVALHGGRMLVGAPSQVVASMPYAGKAYVFEFDGAAWSETAAILASDVAAGAYFAADVALGDDRFVAGRGDDWHDFFGGAYVFRLDGGTWVEEAQLSAQSPQSSDYFYHVAMQGDVITVGADQRWGTGPGFVEVFRRTGATTWAREAHLTPSDGTPGDGFSEVVFDGDAMAVASISVASIGSTGVYLFGHDVGGWHELQKAVPSSYQTYMNHFGFHGTDLLVGAAYGNGGTGCAYAFSLGPDCNDNGVGDACDIMGGSSADVNLNGVPDECDDSDGDGLSDGEELALAAGSGCPDPFVADSDDDGLLDGAELALGTNPCDTDTDGDGIADGVDPTPLTPGVTQSFLTDAVAEIATEVIPSLSTTLFVGPSQAAKIAKKVAMDLQTIAAAALIQSGHYQAAAVLLKGVLRKVDGVGNDDWMTPSPEKSALAAELQLMINLTTLM
ncbi:MAG: hypothetical protein U0572_16325 [Phycisphaerales bacterium]